MSVPPDSRQKCRAALYGFGQTASLGAIARVAGLWARQLPDGGPRGNLASCPTAAPQLPAATRRQPRGCPLVARRYH